MDCFLFFFFNVWETISICIYCVCVEVASFGLLPFSFSSTSGKPSPSVSTVFGVEVASFGLLPFSFSSTSGKPSPSVSTVFV
ncbi:hypothetical protein H1220_02225 [Carnobacteriaceae bacterium zg-84]|nr:hypothetical protein H1220_02225 [Carnobacteriaceae bacterium zg-84]